MREKEKQLSAKISEREIVSMRIFDAPIDLVFKAWTAPEHLKLWWGPKDFTNTFHEFDLRPGGNWKFVMHGPDGTDYENHSVFVEINKPERLVFEHVSQHHYVATITFEEIENQTKVAFSMLFDTREEFDRIKKYIEIGNEQNFDRLEAELVRMEN
ncbi:polyketide cyclase [Leptospira tipperaryensis]|uniref:Polyketide cyclase n=1 Tax=Leptospira tipperaryensis TaxID=2564040 RepID=A0A1D7V247_9LEPT|nr:SRPBCC family protein [Leptospira tipperaryensis]AOP35892.1 polyketide cyclase [Leptospira tipperaryensis]